MPSGFMTMMNAVSGLATGGTYVEGKPNPHYPAESMEAFISRMIQAKKRRIEMNLDVLGLTSEPALDSAFDLDGDSVPGEP